MLFKLSLFKQEHLSKTLKGAILSFILRAGGVVWMFAAYALLARAMDIGQYGQFIYAMTLIPMLAIVAQAGIPDAALRFIAFYTSNQAWSLKRGFFEYAFKTCSVVGIGLAAASFFLSFSGWLPNPMIETALRYGGVSIALFALLQVAAQILRITRKILYSQVFDQWVLPLSLSAFAGISLLTGMVLSARVVLIYYALTLSVITYLIWRLAFSFSPHALPERETKAWLKASFPLMLAALGAVGLGRLDVLVLGIFTDATDIAHYGVASRIAGLMIFGMTAIGVAATPIVSKLYHEKNHEVLNQFTKKIMRIILVTNLVTFIGLWIFGIWLLKAFGQEYVEALTYLRILSVGQLLNFSAGVVSNILILSGHHRQYLRLVWLQVLASIILLPLAAYSLGALGTAIAATIIMVGYSLCLIFEIKRHTGIRFF